jgi:serine/threonine protein kinase
MNDGLGDAKVDLRAKAAASDPAQASSVCPSCGTKLPPFRPAERCPVCQLRSVLDAEEESTLVTVGIDPISAVPDKPATVLSLSRLDHYELLTHGDGTAVELGRGAMGVTYKAIDINLRCPVALKVVHARFVNDESARLRFVREARAAARLRHPNVAAVFHLGRIAGEYFYAMEFVEGETLGNLVKRSGRLEASLALEIATQVAAGLTAIHKQKLIHRDIKPTNIMVRLSEERRVTAKIIDLGLAKTLEESASEARISTPGAFAGTPEFASPEQFVGVGVDIRSDLYSLGVTLWEMVTGQAVFRGSPAEVMYQHLHAPLPLERLQGIPQPVIALLKVLLEKDPRRRFQNPAELLKAILATMASIKAGRRITRRNLLKAPSTVPRVRTRRPPTRLGSKEISLAGLPVTGSGFFGRDEDIAFLDNAWANRHVNVVTIVAWAGVGKSTLVNHWLRRMAAKRYRSAERVFGWSFYRQGTSGALRRQMNFLMLLSLGLEIRIRVSERPGKRAKD